MRELNIDWPALYSAFQMNMPEVRCFFSLEDGNVLRVPPGSPRLAEVRQQTSKYTAIEAVPSRIQYQWLDDFIRGVTDPPVRTRMEAAINGKGAFRRFKDILLSLPDERRRWFELRDTKMRERIVEWVAEQGVQAQNEPPWLSEAPSGEATTGEAMAQASETTDGSPEPTALALRDFLVSWSEGKGVEALEPSSLEELARRISEDFEVRTKDHTL